MHFHEIGFRSHQEDWTGGENEKAAACLQISYHLYNTSLNHWNDPCIYARCLETELRLHLFLMKDGLVEYVTFGLCVWLQEIYVHILDLTETKKVWEFAESFKKKYKTLNVLVRLLLKLCIYKVWGQ